MRKIKVVPHGWRWHLAQAFLRVLYGRGYHYISPWKHAAVAASVLFTYNGKYVLGLRAGNIERAGTWGLVGGHVHVENYETLLQGLAREVREECGLTLDSTRLHEHRPDFVILKHHADLFEQADVSALVVSYGYTLTPTEFANLRADDETSEFKLFTLAEIQQLYAMDKLGFYDQLLAVEHVAAIKKPS